MKAHLTRSRLVDADQAIAELVRLARAAHNDGAPLGSARAAAGAEGGGSCASGAAASCASAGPRPPPALVLELPNTFELSQPLAVRRGRPRARTGEETAPRHLAR